MKQTWILLCALLCTCLLLSACGKQPVEQENYIGIDSALEFAKTHAAKTSSEEFVNIEAELDEEDGTVFYDIEFEDSLTYYEYDIDAISGKLLRAKRKGKPQDMPLISFLIPNATTAPEPEETTAE